MEKHWPTLERTVFTHTRTNKQTNKQTHSHTCTHTHTNGQIAKENQFHHSKHVSCTRPETPLICLACIVTNQASNSFVCVYLPTRHQTVVYIYIYIYIYIYANQAPNRLYVMFITPGGRSALGICIWSDIIRLCADFSSILYILINIYIQTDR